MMNVEYIGLLRHDGTEPPREAGYRRVPVQATDRQVVFPEVTAPGYGMIAQMAVYADETSIEPMDVLTFPVALDVHEGVVPVIHNGTLYRGVEVQAEVVLNSADLCRTGDRECEHVQPIQRLRWVPTTSWDDDEGIEYQDGWMCPCCGEWLDIFNGKPPSSCPDCGIELDCMTGGA